MPDEDATWPRCTEHEIAPWCDCRRQHMLNGRDGADIQRGLRICVPIMPALGHYAQVAIGTEDLGGGISTLELVKTKGLYSMTEEFITLGLWSPGEGRSVMATIIQDWARAQEAKPCKQSTHGFTEEQIVQALLEKRSEPEFKEYLWCIIYHEACVMCYKRQVSTGVAVSVASRSFNAADFGLSPNDPSFRTRNQGQGRRDATTAALRNRFRT